MPHANWRDDANAQDDPVLEQRRRQDDGFEDRPNLFATETGIASFMADEIHGRMTANGELYDIRQMTAAHRTLPFNTVVSVKNLANGKIIDVRINDRGPYVDGRIIDLSFEAAKLLGLVERGSGMVELRVVRYGR
jgi:rare lipoprotein A